MALNPLDYRLLLQKPLSALEDVEIITPQDGQVLTFNGSTNTWVNAAGGGGGGGTGNVSSDNHSTTKLVATTGFSGEAGDEELNGGLLMQKNFAAVNGTSYLANDPPGAYSQPIYFGPPNVAGSWRIAAVQKTFGTAGTELSFEKFDGTKWVSIGGFA